MASNPDTTVPTTMQPPQPVVGGFRLGEEHASDVSDSEDDQSVTSERGAKPPQQSQPLQALQASQAEDKSTRSSRRRKNKQTRHEIGALQNDLDIVLENAFSASAPESDIAPGAIEQVDGDQIMEIESTDSGKKMNKRTRQNMAKMLARKQNGDRSKFHKEREVQDQAAAAERRGLTLEDYRKQRNHGGRDMTKGAERKLRKQKQRARRAEEEANKMEIG